MTTFIFDFDGTIADSLSAIINAFNKHTKSSNGKEIHLDDLSWFQNLSSIEIIKQLKISTLKLPFLLYKIKNSLKHTITATQPYPNINKVLKSLKQKGHTIGILTSNSVNNVSLYIKHHHIQEFDFIYSEHTLFKKARALKKLLKRHKIPSAEAIYIGDETRDIKAAKQCGIRSVAVTWGLHNKTLLAKYSPDFIIEKPEELLEIE